MRNFGHLVAPSAILAALLLAGPLQAEVFLTQDFENVAQPDDNFPKFYKESPVAGAVSVVTEKARSGQKALKVDFAAADWKAGEPKRAEIYSVAWGPHGMTLGQDWWVGFSEYLPADWQPDYPNNAEIVWQFHGYEGGPASNNPPLAAVISGDQLIIRLSQGTVPAAGATSYLDLATLPIPKGKWSDVVLDLNFEYQKGHVRMWLDGKKIVDYAGPTLYPMIGQKNQDGPGLKLGVYKWDWGNLPSQVKRRTLYVDEIRFGDRESSYEEVRPR